MGFLYGDLCGVEFILGDIKVILHFLPFHVTEKAHVVEIRVTSANLQVFFLILI